MYRIELASGEETVFRTIEELATAIRNGVINTRARIYHNASQKWLPIEFHPHYKKALELPASPVTAVESGHPRTPDFRPSGPQPTPAPAHPDPVQHHPAPVQHQPALVQQPAPVQHHPAPVQHQPGPIQHQSAPLQHQPAPWMPAHRVSAEPHPAPVQHYPTPVQQHRAPVQHASPPISVPPPVPSPVLQLTRPSFTPPSAQPTFGATEVGLALEEPPPPAEDDEAPPATPVSSGSWIRGPIKLAVIGAIAIVCTRVVVSAVAPGSESRSLAETAPRPAPAQPTTLPASAVSAETEPGAAMTAGPAFSPGIVTSAQAAQAPAPSPSAVRAPATHGAPAAAPTDSIDAVDPAPTTVDLALPDVPRTDSLARAASTSDSGAIRRILRAVTSPKPGPINTAQ